MIFTAFCPTAFNMCGPLDVQVGVAGLQSASQTTASDRGYDRSAERYVAMGLASNQTWLGNTL